jgi:hypothetical protein
MCEFVKEILDTTSCVHSIAGELGWRRLNYERCAEEGEALKKTRR